MAILGQLYRLQVVDLELEEKSAQLAEVTAGLGETDDLVQARQQLADKQAHLGQLRKEAHELELQDGEIGAKLKANQDRLYGGKVTNPKELSGLQSEAASLRRRRSELEDRELELMSAIEAAETELAESQAHLRRVDGAWQADQARLRAEQDRLQARLAELEETRDAMRAQLGPSNLDVYDDVRRRVGSNGIALMRSGICQVCGVDVPVTMARMVERGQGLNYCPICSRLLYAGG